MASKHDYYETLGVARGASDDEIRKAYRKLARKYHPRSESRRKSAEERFKNVQEAYDILSDPKKRQMYDQYGFYSDRQCLAPAAPGARGAGRPGYGFRRLRFFRVSRRRRRHGAQGRRHRQAGAARVRLRRSSSASSSARSGAAGSHKPAEAAPTSSTPSTSISGRRSKARRSASTSTVRSSAKLHGPVRAAAIHRVSGVQRARAKSIRWLAPCAST